MVPLVELKPPLAFSWKAEMFVLGPPTIFPPKLRLPLRVQEVKLAAAPKVALAFRAGWRPLMLSIASALFGSAQMPEALKSVRVVRPVEVRSAQVKVPVIVGLKLEAAPI